METKEITEFKNITINTEGIIKRNDKPLKPYPNTKGYSLISLHKTGDKKVYTFLVHRLVALAFIPNPENKKEVNHKNGIKWDNRVDNLEWNTHKENIHHSIFVLGNVKTALRMRNPTTTHTTIVTSAKTTFGINNGRAKLNEMDIINIRKSYGTISQKQISIDYNVKAQTISKIIHRKTWKHI